MKHRGGGGAYNSPGKGGEQDKKVYVVEVKRKETKESLRSKRKLYA